MTESIHPYEAYLENLNKMNQIASEMRLQNPENAEMQRSAQNGDNHAILKVEFPDSGGVYTYMEGFAQPYEGFPYYDFVDRIDLLKKIGRSFLSGIFHTFKNKKLRLIFLVPIVPFLPSFFYIGVYTYHRFVERFNLKPLRYCRTSREIYRVFTLERKENARDRDLRVKLRDLICMMLEMDNAYRFRFQNIIEELDQIKAQKNLIKELLRLCDISMQREKTQEIKDTWALVKLFIKYYLRFDRKLQRLAKDIVGNLNISNIVMSEGDREFSSKRKDYDFSKSIN